MGNYMPYGKEHLGHIKLTCVIAKEKPGSSVCKQDMEWVLLTNKKVTNNSEAVRIVEYYLCRWEIETFFKVLKSGCKIENLQLEKKENLCKCISLYMIVAWRIMYLLKLGREMPDLPSLTIFSEIELKCLYGKVGKKKKRKKSKTRRGNKATSKTRRLYE